MTETVPESIAHEYRDKYIKPELRFEKTIKLELIDNKYTIPYSTNKTIFKNLKIKLLKPNSKINYIDIIIGNQIVEHIEGKFFRLLRNILEVDVQNIPSYLFNEGISQPAFHSIQFYVDKFELDDIEVYIDQYKSSLPLKTYLEKYNTGYNLPFNEIISSENKIINILSGLIIENEFEEIELNNKKYKFDDFTKIGDYYYILFDELIVSKEIVHSIENKFWFISVNNYKTLHNMGGKAYSYK